MYICCVCCFGRHTRGWAMNALPALGYSACWATVEDVFATLAHLHTPHVHCYKHHANHASSPGAHRNNEKARTKYHNTRRASSLYSQWRVEQQHQSAVTSGLCLCCTLPSYLSTTVYLLLVVTLLMMWKHNNMHTMHTPMSGRSVPTIHHNTLSSSTTSDNVGPLCKDYYWLMFYVCCCCYSCCWHVHTHTQARARSRRVTNVVYT